MSSERQPRNWTLKDPIERKVLLLVIMLVLMAATFIGTETIRQAATSGMRADLENQSARRSLGNIILNKLLLVEKDAIMLAGVADDRDVEIIHKRIQYATGEVKKILTILQNGGTYANVLPTNFGDLDEVSESIAFSPPQTTQYVMEVIDLTPKIIDVETHARDLQSAVHRKLQVDSVPRTLVENIAYFSKQMEATIIRSQETANKVNYDTSLRINDLDAAIVGVERRFSLMRNTVSIAVFMLGMVICLRTLGQIRSIVAERADYARKLREANASINQMAEALPVGIAVVDTASTVLKVNRYALQMLEADTADEVVGRSCRELFCTTERENCPLVHGKLTSFAGETTMVTRSGVSIPVIKRAINLRLNNRDVILEAFVDISDRVKAERELLEKQNFIDTILKAATVGIVVVDAENHSIVEANPAALDLIGAARSDVIGATCNDWMSGSRDSGCPVTDQGMSIYQNECIIQDTHGRDVPIVKNISTTMLNGRLHLVESFFNIAPLKAAEARVRRLNEELEQRVTDRTNELQERNDDLKAALDALTNTQARLLQSEKMASIGQLAAGVAHEINNPVGYVKSNLSAIDGYRTDLLDLIEAYEKLRAAVGQDAGDRQAEIADHIRSVAELREEIDVAFIQDDFASVLEESVEGMDRVANIVADLKNFAHMDGDTLEPADINDIMQSTLNIVWNELKYKAEVIKDLGELPPIRCYPQRLGQVFMNLLVNAGQAIDTKGSIRITTRAEDTHVLVQVADTGCGIPEEHLTRIYDPFFTTKPVGKGTGLGLNVVYNIVKSHQGSVDVQTAPGTGTTFTLRLPRELTPEAETPSPADAPT